jgi:alkylation response protein AidB-like acyl-CoA dehydrogenase
VADGVGAAARALERALEYAKQREQFGRPIGGFQAVQHLLVDMLQDVERARAAAYYALWAQDAAPPIERARATALAKAFASEALPRVGATAIQVFGGIGFTVELDVHLYYRRLVSLSLLYGDAGHQLERVAEFAFAREGRD